MVREWHKVQGVVHLWGKEACMTEEKPTGPFWGSGYILLLKLGVDSVSQKIMREDANKKRVYLGS